MKSKEYIVDRIEGDLLILQDKNEKIITIDKSKVDKVPEEGDILIKVGNIYKVDIESTKEYKLKVDERTKGMWVE